MLDELKYPCIIHTVKFHNLPLQLIYLLICFSRIFLRILKFLDSTHFIGIPFRIIYISIDYLNIIWNTNLFNFRVKKETLSSGRARSSDTQTEYLYNQAWWHINILCVCVSWKSNCEFVSDLALISLLLQISCDTGIFGWLLFLCICQPK